MGCGCPACAGMERKKKILFGAMILFGVMAIFHAMMAGIIHLILHGKDVCTQE